jgi:hypothetical protein
MINKNFGQITYPNTFQAFEFEDSGTDGPYNGGRGVNLAVTKSTTSETVPILGSRAPIEITQNSDLSVDKTGVLIVGKYSQAQSYGVIFAIRDHINSGIAKTVIMYTENGTCVSKVF